MTDKVYSGWLPGNEEDRDALRAIGIFGPMVWRKSDLGINRYVGKSGNFEHCLCYESALDRLDEIFQKPWETNHPDYNDAVFPKRLKRYSGLLTETSLDYLRVLYGPNLDDLNVYIGHILIKHPGVTREDLEKRILAKQDT